MFAIRSRAFGDPAALPPATAPAVTAGPDVASQMVLRGAVGSVVGAAASPAGNEGAWGVLGFAMGAMLGEYGIVGVALAAMWRKMDRRTT